MKPFGLLIDYDVLEYVVRLSRTEEKAIRKRMLQIRDYPGNSVDYYESDDLGREYPVNVFGKHAIKYWIDDADRQVKIMQIRPADRTR